MSPDPSKSISYYERYLRNKRHGNLKDWVILCYAWVSTSGPIETATLRKLRGYKTIREYRNGKDAQSSKETVKCAFSKARRALSSCLSADEKLRSRKLSRHDEFEFGLIASKRKAKIALLENPLLSAKDKSNLQMKIDDAELSIRTANCLKNSNLSYVGDLTLMTESEMLEIPNFGHTSLNELRQLLAAMGLRFADEPSSP